MSSSTEFTLPLQGKLAIVTGASRGLGEGMAWELARRGASVALSYVSDSSRQRIEQLSARIRALPHQPAVYACQADLSTLEGPRAVVDQLRAAAGRDGRLTIDIVVNNAGTERAASLADLGAADYEAIFDVNVRGPLLLTQAARARVINVSSVGARAAFPGLGLYISSKAALEGLTRCWAAELGGNGTTVNAVCPGPVQSDMLDNIPPELVELQKRTTPLQHRIGTVEEVARIVAWLAGEDSAWVTGQAISASGGWATY